MNRQRFFYKTKNMRIFLGYIYPYNLYSICTTSLGTLKLNRNIQEKKTYTLKFCQSQIEQEKIKIIDYILQPETIVLLENQSDYLAFGTRRIHSNDLFIHHRL